MYMKYPHWTDEKTEVRGSIPLGRGIRQSNPRLWALNHSPKRTPQATWKPAVLKAIPRVSTETLGGLWSPGLSVTVIGDKQSGGEINHLIQNHTKPKPTGTALGDLCDGGKWCQKWAQRKCICEGTDG